MSTAFQVTELARTLRGRRTAIRVMHRQCVGIAVNRHLLKGQEFAVVLTSGTRHVVLCGGDSLTELGKYADSVFYATTGTVLMGLSECAALPIPLACVASR